MEFRKSLLASTIILNLFGCGGSSTDQSGTKTIELGAFKQECVSFFYTFCNTSVSSDGLETSLVFQPILGFDYEWGYEYTIRYRDTPIPNPPADALNIRRELIEVQRKDPVTPGTEFKLALRASDPNRQQDAGFIQKLTNGQYSVLTTVEIQCEIPQVCSELDTVIEDDLAFVGTFTFRPELGLPIILKNIECTEPNRRRRIQCDKTMGLLTEMKTVDTFSQDATEFSIGETIGFNMMLTNTGSEDIVLDGGLCQDLSISVSFTSPYRDQLVWRFQSGASDCVVTGLENLRLTPGSGAMLTVPWDQTDSSGSPINLPGGFVIASWFLNQPEHRSFVMIR